MTSWRCDGVVGLKVFSAIARRSRPQIPVVTSIRWPSAERDDRLLVVGAAAGTAANPLELAHDADRVDRVDLDVEQPLDRRLDLALGRVSGTRKITWLCSDALVAFSVITGVRMMSYICWRVSRVSARGMTRNRLI